MLRHWVFLRILHKTSLLNKTLNLQSSYSSYWMTVSTNRLWNPQWLHPISYSQAARDLCSAIKDNNKSFSPSDAQPVNQMSLEFPMQPVLDFHKMSTSSDQNLEDVERRVSFNINGTTIQMKAVELYEAIRKMAIEEILSMFENSYWQLDKTHFSLCLKRMNWFRFKMEADPNYKEYIGSIQADRRFHVLCGLVGQKACYLEPSVAADMVFFLTNFGLDSSHPVMKHLLELAKHFINDLAIDQLAVLTDNLSRMSVSQQTVVLTEAIKLLCQSKNRAGQVDMLTPWHRSVLLNSFGDCLPYTEKLLLDLWHERDKLNLSRIIMVLKSLGRVTKTKHRQLELWCVNSICENVASLTVDDALAIANTCCHLRLYSINLCHKLGEMKNLLLEDRINLWCCLADQGFLHIDLMHEILTDQTDFVQLKLPVHLVLKLVAYLGNADATKSKLRESLKLWTTENLEILQKQLSPSELLDFSLNLTTLGVQPDKTLLKQLFSSEFLEKCSVDETKVYPISLPEKFCLLNDFTKFLVPNDSFLLKLNNMNRRLPRPLSDLSGAVNHLWPGLAKHACFTESGLFVDFVLNLPDGRKRVAVICWPNIYFWRNTSQLKSVPKLFAKQIQKDGYDVVVINTNLWRKTVDHERLHYLKYRVESAATNQDLIM